MQIYKIINLINKKVYIGKDKNNIKNYFGSGKLIKQAIKKYGLNNFKKEIIQECYSLSEMNEKEIFWIKELNTITPAGYNITKGGDGGDTWSNHPNRLNIIEKARKSNTGKKRSAEFCVLMQNVGKSVSSEIRKNAAKNANITKSNRDHTEKELQAYKLNAEKLIQYNKSNEGRERVSKQFKGKKKAPFSDEHRKNIGNSSRGRKIPGRKIEIDGIFYESLHDAHRKLNIPLMTIRNRLLNKNFPSWNYCG